MVLFLFSSFGFYFTRRFDMEFVVLYKLVVIAVVRATTREIFIDE